MKALNGACLFAYEIHLITAKQNDDPKSLADIQRSILNGKKILDYLKKKRIKRLRNRFLRVAYCSYLCLIYIKTYRV